MYKELNKVFSMIQTGLKSEKVELTNEKIELSLKKLEQINLSVLEKVNSDVKTEIKSINNTRRKLVQRMEAVSDDVKSYNKILFDADGEVKSIIKTVEDAGISAAPMKQRLNEINKLGQKLMKISSQSLDIKNSIERSL